MSRGLAGAAELALATMLAVAASSCDRPNPAFRLRTPAPDSRPGGGDAGADAAAEVTADLAGDLAAADGVDDGVSAGDGVGPDRAPPVDAAGDGPLIDGSTPADGQPDLPPDTTALAGCPDDSDLVLCLRFENQAADGSRNRLPMSVSGLGFEPGRDGQAGRFGPQTRVLVQPAGVLDVGTLTVEAWINPRALPGTASRMGIVDYTRQYAFFLHPNGELSCIVVTSSGVQTLRVAAMVQAQLWQLVACTFDGSELAVWRNGLRLDSKTINPLDPSDSTESMVIGGHIEQRSPDPFDGLMDNVHVWRRARSGTEMCGGAAPPCL